MVKAALEADEYEDSGGGEAMRSASLRGHHDVPFTVNVGARRAASTRRRFRGGRGGAAQEFRDLVVSLRLVGRRVAEGQGDQRRGDPRPEIKRRRTRRIPAQPVRRP